ncbi:major facilitator superfamily domain-containing protein 6-A-like [Cherax quadricarinatus]
MVCARITVRVDGWWQLDAQVTLDNTSLKVPAWSCSLLPQHQSGEASGWTSKTNTSSKAQECYAQCLALVPRQQVCSNSHTILEFRPVLTYMLFLLMMLINGITLVASQTLFKGATIAILREHNGDYGLQRISGSLGAIVLTPLSGALVDIFSGDAGQQDFRPTFYMYCVLKVAASLAVLCLNLDFRMPSSKVTKDFKSLLKRAEVLTFLLAVIFTGTFFGILDAFLFWLLQDLGASNTLLGITVTVGTAAGIPILVASKHIISTLGHANTLIFGLAFYVVRMIGYSYIQDPWWCLPFEALECFTVSLMDAACVSYGDALATPSTIATLQGMYGGLHYGIGRALGSLIGGNLIKVVGIRNTFRGAAGVSALACILYFFINYNCFRKQQQERRQKAISEKTNKATVTEEKKHTEDKITKFTADDNIPKQEYLSSAFNGELNYTDSQTASKSEYVNLAFVKEANSINT